MIYYKNICFKVDKIEGKMLFTNELLILNSIDIINYLFNLHFIVNYVIHFYPFAFE